MFFFKFKKKCNMCGEKISSINFFIKKGNKKYFFCSECCYYNWLRKKAGIE